MTSEEIKAKYTMEDIVRRYAFKPNRRGFISCPFHDGDSTPSLKVYERDFYCHSCGAHGDIFEFVQMMDGVDFKDAYQSLGGTYGKPTFSSRRAIYQAKKQREMRQKAEQRMAEKRRLNCMLIGIYRTYMNRSEPLSDVWCECYNALQYQLYMQAEINGMEARW